MPDKRFSKDGLPVRRRDMGLASVAVILSQVLSSFQSNRDLSKDIQQIRTEFHQIRDDQEKYFVRKEELRRVDEKLDLMNTQLAQIRVQIKKIGDIARFEMRGHSKIDKAGYHSREDF